MNLDRRRATFVFAASAAAAVSVPLLRPTAFIADRLGDPRLTALLPRSFGDWSVDGSAVAQVVNPEQTELLNRLYSEVVSLTYIDEGNRYRVMLSIAYGRDQRDALQFHYPEVCYPSQGFQLKAITRDALATRYGVVPVTRLETSRGSDRPEPVTYWVTVGARPVRGALQKKFAEMHYTLVERSIPDGLLFRVSSIDRATRSAFEWHDRFVRSLLDATPESLRQRLGVRSA